MRELEFRAWCPGNKVMVEFTGKDLHDSIVARNFGELMANEHENGKDLLMQFTGVKDFFDTKIFEGDIVFIDSEMRNGYVVYDTCEFKIKFSDEYQWLCDYYENAHVIGNIHENSVLLERGL